MQNPLLVLGPLPNFSCIEPEKIEAALKQLLVENRSEIARILAQAGPFTWENLIEPLDEMNDRLAKFWSPI